MGPNVTASKLKSILKKSQILDEEDDEAIAERQKHAREVAIKHAKAIQVRKEIEAQVLDSLVILSEFPRDRSPACSALNPAVPDVHEFKARIRFFQSGDYDDLVEERNHNGLCGYSLCAKPRIKVAGTGAWKIVNTGRKDFNIVPKADIEKWCSTKCARRAMYIRLQLVETTVWERAGNHLIQIDLLDEGQKNAAAMNQIVSDMDKMKLNEDMQTTKNLRELAQERGESGRYGNDTTRVPVTIAPKEDVVMTSDHEEDNDPDSHMLIDGYKPTIG
ncbi:hypothetical protein TD95_001134 [Thielaviopsis punctulata]|uniref:RNA polymerase II subunit B1 CTD phosphatase RPAP2 homolog n=1 Tax=Thielaviopsis punctulata TaxID=72032 RepID=A0A0F4Z9A0_9PEZI|nr:hypothetical protein TD95_001134 [Thielaviopsis punctulata]